MKQNKFLGNGLHWYHWVVVVSSLLLTFIAWYVSYSQIQEKIEQRFQFQSEQLLALISERMSRYEDALRAGVATIQSHELEVDANVWRRFSKTLHLERTYPGINGIGVIYHISMQDRERFLEKQRQTLPDFEIKPKHNGGEFWPITFVEPVSINAKALGLDMAFEANRLSAARKARDLGKTQITAPIVLVQDARKTPGFLQFVPFYRQVDLESVESRKTYFVGHVYAPFIMSQLMAGTLERKNRRLLFSVHDKNNELYNELSSSTPGYDPEALFTKEVTVDMYGRPWRFIIQTATSFRQEVSTNQPLYILIGGLAIDSMLLILFIMLSRSHKNALKLAEKMTNKVSVSEYYYRHIIDSAPCGIAIIDGRGIIETINPQMQHLFGYTEKELVGNNIDYLVPDRFRKKHPVYRKEFSHSPQKRRMGIGKEIFCLTKSQSEFPAEIGLAHFSSEGKSKVVATVIDITGYVEVTDELKRSNKELNDFAYIASHDLKAPLRGIIQLSNWIEEDIIESASDETKENLALLRNRTSRLDKLLDDLLAYSRVGRKHGDIQEVSVELLLTNLLDLLDPKKRMALVVQENLPAFRTYVAPLETVFRNLFSNVLKHHDKENGQIEVKFQEFSDSYEFSISDDGPGIASQHHGQIFELFKTLKPRDEVEGSGMGLSIVKKIIEYQGQSIEVLSEGESGTTFRFRWPKSVE